MDAFLHDGVKYIGVVGEGCAHIEDLIDEMVVGDGTETTRFILTASHPGESLAAAVEFAEVVIDKSTGDVQVLEA